MTEQETTDKGPQIKHDGWIFTHHAIERFGERKHRQETPQKLAEEMANMLESRTSLGKRQWHAAGWVFVLRGHIVITVTKPKIPATRNRIEKVIHSRKHARRRKP